MMQIQQPQQTLAQIIASIPEDNRRELENLHPNILNAMIVDRLGSIQHSSFAAGTWVVANNNVLRNILWINGAILCLNALMVIKSFI